VSEKEHDCLHLHRMVVIALLLLIDLQKFGHFHHVSSVTSLVIKLVAGELIKRTTCIQLEFSRRVYSL